jgi:hypothetical protein
LKRGRLAVIIRARGKEEALVSEWLQEWGTTIAATLALAAALLAERCRSLGRSKRMARIRELDRLRRLGS